VRDANLDAEIEVPAKHRPVSVVPHDVMVRTVTRRGDEPEAVILERCHG
jgi:hypothetical protein